MFGTSNKRASATEFNRQQQAKREGKATPEELRLRSASFGFKQNPTDGTLVPQGLVQKMDRTDLGTIENDTGDSGAV